MNFNNNKGNIFIITLLITFIILTFCMNYIFNQIKSSSNFKKKYRSYDVNYLAEAGIEVAKQKIISKKSLLNNFNFDIIINGSIIKVNVIKKEDKYKIMSKVKKFNSYKELIVRYP